MLHQKQLVAAAVLILTGLAAYAQNAQRILPLTSPVVSLLRSLYLEQGMEPLSASGPFSVDEIGRMLDKIDPSKLSPAGQRAYDAARAEVDPRAVAEPMGLSASIHPRASLEAYLRTGGDASPIPWQGPYNERLPLFSVPVEAWIGESVYAAIDIALGQNPDGANRLLVPGNYTNWTTDVNALDSEIPQRALVAAGGPHWSFVIGRDRFSWGEGQTGDVLLSDSPDYNDFARITAYWDNIKYTAMWVMLNYGLDPQYRFPVWGLNGGDLQSNDNYPRNLFVHRIDFSLFNRVSIGISEGILIGGVQPDLVYFNPLMIFHDLYHWGHASTIASLEASGNPWKYLELYGQLALNQLQLPYEVTRYGASTSDIPDAYAVLGGIRSRVPIWQGYADAGVEGVDVSPWMYIRENRLISYEWWRWTNSNVPNSPEWVSAPLGYSTGPDALVFSAWVGYEVPSLFSVGVEYRRTAKGEQTLATPYVADSAAAALTTPSGTPEYSNVLHLAASGDILPFLRLASDLYWISVDNLGHALGVSATDFQAQVSVTLHKDF